MRGARRFTLVPSLSVSTNSAAGMALSEAAYFGLAIGRNQSITPWWRCSRPWLPIQPTGFFFALSADSTFRAPPVGKWNLVIVIDGIYYALALAGAGAVVAWLVSPWFAGVLWLLALFCLYFFRDPERAIPPGPVAVSPADGKVVAVKAESPTLQRISIFLNIFDVHVNRAPVAGAITAVQYRAGRFLVASREKCSAENEQNVVTVEGDGSQVRVDVLLGPEWEISVRPGMRVAAGSSVIARRILPPEPHEVAHGD
jgi:phosphatidylserine decarboxylase